MPFQYLPRRAENFTGNLPQQRCRSLDLNQEYFKYRTGDYQYTNHQKASNHLNYFCLFFLCFENTGLSHQCYVCFLSCYFSELFTRGFIRKTGTGNFRMKTNVVWNMARLSFMEILSTIQNNLPKRVIYS
jgi:hypothetical protein